jgi:hydrogenase maturation protein HypF
MNQSPHLPTSSNRRLAVVVRGVVQGVGFRPFVFQTAQTHGLTGWVRNEADNVRIELQGEASALDAFFETLRHAHPAQAHIDAIDIQEIPRQDNETDAGRATFQIQMSSGTAAPRPTIPADLATCAECLAEIRDPSQRRFHYPFTNCTNCGPRWSIIEQLPYDRPRTSMASFPMCDDCRAEYENPSDRRFHAQPIACPRCGPMLQLLDPKGNEIATGEAALTATAQAILQGQIAALKGLGGFQLLVDATNADAVEKLRHRKHRPDRPFALMMPSLEMVRQYCEVSEEEAKTLISHQSPIVLLRTCETASGCCAIDQNQSTFSPLSPHIAPGNPYLGVMLPYTPLHHLLMQAIARPVVCTSGNLSEEPMAIVIDDALTRLGSIVDVLLTHNRPIVRPVDDSIVRVDSEGVQIFRRARGFAPLAINLHVEAGRPPTILAVGGHLKNTVALALGRVRETHHEKTPMVRCTHPTQVVMSAHVGDLDSVLSVEVFRQAADDLLQFFQVVPEAVVCDLHPDYASTRYAEQLSGRFDVPLLRVQHHHAHVAACMAEHGFEGSVLGFAWDGTGYGPDETVWGGEALLCEGAEYRRGAHLRTFHLPGGDTASREPRRSALGVLFEIFGSQASEYASTWFDAGEINTLLLALSRRINAPRTSSMGRLFDAVAAICGLSSVASFEGQAAMALEFAADEQEKDAYPIPLIASTKNSSQPIAALQADWEPMIRAALADRAAGVSLGRISGRFHNALADMALAIAREVGAIKLPIVLTGGCFQNALLTARVRARLSSAGFQVYTHKQVPPGDGGIALGQTLLALRQLRGKFDVSGNPG